MHKLDPSCLGNLRPGEVRAWLTELLAAPWSGTTLAAAWIRAMLRRHLARLSAVPLPGLQERDPDAPVVDHHHLVLRLRTALPRFADDALRRDLAELLQVLERDLKGRHGRAVPD